MTFFDSLDNMKGYLYLSFKIKSCYDFMELPQVYSAVSYLLLNSSRTDLNGRYFCIAPTSCGEFQFKRMEVIYGRYQ